MCSICKAKHKHYSSLGELLLKKMDNDVTFYCGACDCEHVFYEEGSRIKLLLGSSTLAGLRDNFNKGRLTQIVFHCHNNNYSKQRD